MIRQSKGMLFFNHSGPKVMNSLIDQCIKLNVIENPKSLKDKLKYFYDKIWKNIDNNLEDIDEYLKEFLRIEHESDTNLKIIDYLKQLDSRDNYDLEYKRAYIYHHLITCHYGILYSSLSALKRHHNIKTVKARMDRVTLTNPDTATGDKLKFSTWEFIVIDLSWGNMGIITAINIEIDNIRKNDLEIMTDNEGNVSIKANELENPTYTEKRVISKLGEIEIDFYKSYQLKISVQMLIYIHSLLLQMGNVDCFYNIKYLDKPRGKTEFDRYTMEVNNLLFYKFKGHSPYIAIHD